MAKEAVNGIDSQWREDLSCSKEREGIGVSIYMLVLRSAHAANGRRKRAKPEAAKGQHELGASSQDQQYGNTQRFEVAAQVVLV